MNRNDHNKNVQNFASFVKFTKPLIVKILCNTVDTWLWFMCN